MADSNHTGTSFFLTGLPGLEAVHTWLSIPLCAMYVAALAGNSLILWVVRSEPSLHQPMYYFLSMLAVTDLGLSASTLPTMLSIYMLGVREVALDVCLAQLFFIHTFSIMESSVLLAMAFDRSYQQTPAVWYHPHKSQDCQAGAGHCGTQHRSPHPSPHHAEAAALLQDSPAVPLLLPAPRRHEAGLC